MQASYLLTEKRNQHDHKHHHENEETHKPSSIITAVRIGCRNQKQREEPECKCECKVIEQKTPPKLTALAPSLSVPTFQRTTKCGDGVNHLQIEVGIVLNRMHVL